MAPFLSGRYVLQYVCWRLVNHLNAGEIWQAPDLLGQGAVRPLYNLLKSFGICDASHEANFTTRPSISVAALHTAVDFCATWLQTAPDTARLGLGLAGFIEEGNVPSVPGFPRGLAGS